MIPRLTWMQELITEVDVDAGVQAGDQAVEGSLLQTHTWATQETIVSNHNNEELQLAQFTWSQWLKAPQTGATHTITWIARIHSHTYINTVTTTWCEAMAEFGIHFLF